MEVKASVAAVSDRKAAGHVSPVRPWRQVNGGVWFPFFFRLFLWRLGPRPWEAVGHIQDGSFLLSSISLERSP